ncbi:MAG TPA: L-seryl-tRNA(Sec) selenium transferase [Actinomycetota bacterium]|nr:L-seryl-tRNA(Sec) selenium transferase [Actinomycetota bacterium]
MASAERASEERSRSASDVGPEPGPRRRIPSVDALLRSEPGRRATETFGRPLVKHAISAVLDRVRADAAAGVEPLEAEVILARALRIASDTATGLIRTINATGVVLHTGLGRAPLPERAARAAGRAGLGYVDLEIDRDTGERGRRSTRSEHLLQALTGAEDALVVNNGAAALLLALAALARGKHVVVSRGELIEIGGEFRIPDILAASGARLVEVGTTNRTRTTDYRAAISDRTALLLKVHPSNYRVVGFTAAPALGDLVTLARRAGIPLVYDLGSGLLDRPPSWMTDEPSAAGALGEGADLVIFSGDKLLGGPQAGIVLGRAELVERLRRHPVARAVRVDKMQVAALDVVLGLHAAERRDELPVWRMLGESPTEIRHRAELLARSLDGDLEGAHVVPCESTVGGGSVPAIALPSFGVEVRAPDPAAMAARLRTGSPAVLCRTTDRGVLLDVRTVAGDDLPDLVRAVRYALEGDDLDDG